MDRLSGDYNRGYTKAIQDIIEVFTYILTDLRWHHKNLNAKTSIKLLQAILKNREMLSDDWGGFIRYNGKDDFEWFNPNRDDSHKPQKPREAMLDE